MRKNINQGFSLIELLIVVAIILIIAAIAIPNFMRSKMAANEANAVANLRTINTAAVTYSSAWGNGYPPGLSTLGGSGTTATCDAALILDPFLSTAPYTKSGYTFAYTGNQGTVTSPPGCTNPGFVGYLTTAVPATIYSGIRSFCADEPGVIHQDTSGAVAGSAGACEALPAVE